MAVWPENLRRYQARLEAFGWLCVNFHAYMNMNEDGTPVVSFRAPTWGGIPLEVREELGLKDLLSIRDAFVSLRDKAKAQGTHFALDLDEILEELDWCFSPADIQGLKVVYTPPKDPKWAPKKRKKHEQS